MTRTVMILNLEFHNHNHVRTMEVCVETLVYVCYLAQHLLLRYVMEQTMIVME